VVPSIKVIAPATEGRFLVEDWHDFSIDYAPTCARRENVAARRDWIVSLYGERFCRMQVFYLLSCVGAFGGRTSDIANHVRQARPRARIPHPLNGRSERLVLAQRRDHFLAE
jgi:cyclopropane-fatty-acyl-phospholipid synthase